MLKYTTDNVLISLQRELADAVKDFGYNVRWHITGEVEPQTSASAEAKGTITLVPEFPDDPAFLVRLSGLNDGSTPQENEIAVPAFSLQLPTAPRKVARMGIGETDFERQRGFRISGFTYDDFQQRELMDFFYEWLDGGDTQLRVWDYQSDPAAPPALEPVLVVRASVGKKELIHEVEAIRYYISVDAIISYIE